MAAVAALALALFLNILPNTFVWDDWQQIFQNSFLQAPDGIVQMFNTNVWGFDGRETNYYRPLMHLTFYVTLRLFGFNPAGYHLLSILLHMLCSALVLVLIRRWSGDSMIALLAALLFAALPVHTENLCWISGYPDLEATAFILLAVLLYTSKFGSRGSEWWILRVIGLALCVFLGLLSKEIAIVIPAICLAWGLFPRRAGIVSAFMAVCREHWPDYVAMACGIAPYLALRVNALGGLAPFKTGLALSFSAQVFTRITLFHRYLTKIFWPVELSAFDDFPASLTLWDWRVAAGLGELAIFLWLLVWLWRRREQIGRASCR